MDHRHYTEQHVTEDFAKAKGIVKSISFSILSSAEAEKIAAKVIASASEVTDPALGVPNLSNQCLTCGAKNSRKIEGGMESLCEGHFGLIDFPYTILNPHFLPDIAKVLNKICPGCKSVLSDKAKGRKSLFLRQASNTCKYCDGKSRDYPTMRFRVPSKDMFLKTAIVAEVSEISLRSGKLASDYWDIIPDDPQEEQSTSKSKRLLTHTQVYNILKDVDPKHPDLYSEKKNSIFMNSILVTPNSHRLTEFGQHIAFDASTRLYRKLVDFKGTVNELSTRVLDLLKASKIHAEKLSAMDLAYMSSSDAAATGLRYIKEILLGKRNNHAFRMVVVGDPNIKLDEVGVPCHIAEKLWVSEAVNSYNKVKLERYLDLMLLGEGDVCVRRKGKLIHLFLGDKLQQGDVLHRPLVDGDIVLINRPPSIHQHSFLALYVKILPIISVLSINPLVCSPMRGDFDGDCLHGYVPQSVNTTVELKELVALNKQLIDGQNGRNLLSLSHDSITAAHMILGDGVILSKVQMQQLQMLCPQKQKLLFPAILKSLSSNMPCWTGKQLFSHFLPQNFDYVFPADGVCISKGEIMTASDASSWMRDAGGSLFCHLVKQCKDEFLDCLFAAQEALCEWLSTRGLSVSLADLYLASDSQFRANLMDEVSSGLLEAEQLSYIRTLMVDYNKEFLIESSEESKKSVGFGRERMSIRQQTSAALSQASISSFKEVFSDIQHLPFHYAGRDNSFLAMLRAGSKGNMLKLAQHSMCLGLQHSLVSLSFKIPHRLCCAAWNDYNASRNISLEIQNHPESYIPSAVVGNSFLTGLNPLECFVHSLTNRDGSFSGHADVSGTLHRRLMFFMRDLVLAYDGTVRNSYGNQLVQFWYGDQGTSKSCNVNDEDHWEKMCDQDIMGGHPVGSLAGCAISEAAYSALDQPVSALESSPLLSLKKILECGVKKSSGGRSASLFLSKKVGRSQYGFEYGVLELKSHLDRVQLADIVSKRMISHCPKTSEASHMSPWVCHFHISKEVLKRKGLRVKEIVDALETKRLSGKRRLKYLEHVKITSKDCCLDANQQLHGETCISVCLADSSRNLSLQLEILRDVVMPFLLGTIIKGFHEIKKVDILWKQHPNASNSYEGMQGELYLRVFMSETCDKSRFWSIVVDSCLPLMSMIDWEQSHPDDIHDLTRAYGIDVAWRHFINNLNSAVKDTGKNILSEHLILTADCMSATGEFVALNAKGLSQQRKEFSVASPFSQACFSSPGDCFIKAAKAGVTDDLQGSLDELCWGRTPSIGAGGQFDVIYSNKNHEPAKSMDVYQTLRHTHKKEAEAPVVELPMDGTIELSYKSIAQQLFRFDDSTTKKRKELVISKQLLRKFLSVKDIRRLSKTLGDLLHKYDIDSELSEVDKAVVMTALFFHPRRSEKIGSGSIEIKVGYHAKHDNSRCFQLVRKDGTVEDFSYHKCVHNAYQLIAPEWAEKYESRWLKDHRTTDKVANEPPPSDLRDEYCT